ncbi:hypothetical protein E4T49_08281 [Aureobasidium sp. EXF-10728]|nr:hypothetical protein E4T49_08281 [Aureobasidium sp. EXF-10728]
MLSLLKLAPVFLGLTLAQNAITTDGTTYDVVPTPDAVPVDFLRDVDVPVYTVTPGLDSDIIYYASETAIQAASAQQTESPLSVFPAVTAVPINAAGESDQTEASATTTSAPSKRGIQARVACAPQATISNYYNVNVDSFSAFAADATIASAASSAPSPSGYFNTFTNAAGASSAYAYLGYAIVNGGKTGYDVNWCASKCNAMNGCLSFNIFFERDPVLEPGSGCTNPQAFPNIKCSFWGSALDLSTATNKGQWRSSFQVGIAGSNGYTSYKVGGPIAGWDAPQSLKTSAMNAPVRDCADTWTYMGFKLFQSGPFDPNLCSAACNSQTAYNLAHPPSTGKASKCAAFGTYILTMTNKTGSYQQGQMCTMYTSNWDKQYAVNNVAYDDSIGAKYTYSFSFFYSRPDIQPICKSDINYLVSSGSDFCTSLIGYSAPTVTSTITVTPSLATDLETTTFSTSISLITSNPTATITADFQWRKRQASNDSIIALSEATGVLSNVIDVQTVANVPANSAVVLDSFIATISAPNGTVPTDAPSPGVLSARAAIVTPASVASWPLSRLSEACSDVATGTFTTSSTTTLPTVTTTVYTSVVAATTLQACVIPSKQADYTSFIPVWGAWNGDTVGDIGYGIAGQEKTLQIPFQMTIGGQSSNVITVGVNGYIKIGNSVNLLAFSGQGGSLYLYGGNNGVFYRITGDSGSRAIVFSWYAGTYNWGHQQNHFTITYFEDRPGEVQFKYYDVVQDPGPSATAALYISESQDISSTLRQTDQVTDN